LKITVLGIDFDNLTLQEAVAAAMACLAEEKSSYAVTPNPEIIKLAQENPALAQAIAGAALVLPDGIGVVKAAQILRTPLKEKVPGIDFAGGLMAEMAVSGQRLYLMGAKPGVAAAAAEKLAQQYPGLHICGCRDGYFQQDESEAVAAEIRSSGADVCFVCLGSPRQELWMAEHGAASGAKLLVGLGGSLDVFSGQLKRAPRWMQKAGLEWLYRLMKEPQRLGRMMKIPGVILQAYAERGRSR